jgi:hypothetical protein
MFITNEIAFMLNLNVIVHLILYQSQSIGVVDTPA